MAGIAPARNDDPPAEVFDLREGMGRATMLSQVLFSTVLLLIVGFVFVSDVRPTNSALFYGGAATAIGVSVFSLIFPWQRFHWQLITIVPLVDVIAIGGMHLSMPQVATGLLWVFPILWLAVYLSVPALLTGIGLSYAFIILNALLYDRAIDVADISEWLIMPLVLALIAVASVSSSRRVFAQRQLQRKQAALLAKALARARSQEVLMAEILDAVPFGIVRLASSGEVTLLNRSQEAFERIRGEDNDVFASDGVTRLRNEDDPRVVAVAGAEFVDRIIWYGRAERERVALAVSATRLHVPGQESGDTLLVYRDVTEQLNAVRARDDLISSVSHELRTPLTSMNGYLELVLDGDELGPKVRRQLEIAHRNGNRLLELITQILEASRGQDAVVSIDPEWADLSAVVAQSVESQQIRAAERGIRIEFESRGGCMVRCDPSRIRQVIDNMLSNAIKYNRDSGLVRIDIDDFQNEVAIRVTDTGFGVTPEELPKVFDRHFRSERVRNSTIHGNGLGLSISRDIARQHGGEMEMVSTSGEGSTVMLVLPKGASDALAPQRAS
ncbi:MAG: sensor histidine kinase [Agromyces sp.]